MSDIARCCLCGEPMPDGEQMFKFHGFSGPCPVEKIKPNAEEGAKATRAVEGIVKAFEGGVGAGRAVNQQRKDASIEPLIGTEPMDSEKASLKQALLVSEQRRKQLERALAAAAWTDEDKPLPEDAEIHAHHPVVNESHETYEEALRLVGAKRSKGALVDLVNWLLQLARTASLGNVDENARDAISLSDIQTEIQHIRENGSTLRIKFSEEHEGRCRELCAMYLQEFIIAHQSKQKLSAIDAARNKEGRDA